MKAVIFPNRSKPGIDDIIKETKRILAPGADVYETESASDAFARFPDGADFGVVLGGDGTMLAAAGWASRTGTPLIGINLGTLGYMYELEPDELPMLERVLKNDYKTEKRMMIQAAVLRDGKEVFGCTALNEVVICRGLITKLIDLELTCDGCVAGSYRADGIIIATPTGSTAYSMSAGGPIIDPTLDLITTCAVCPHGRRGANSMVFSPEAVIGVRVSSKYNGDIFITSDGGARTELFYNDEVYVRRSASAMSLIRLKDSTFYKTHSQKFV